MTRDDIKAMMQEAGLKAPARGEFIFIHWDQIALLIKHEREACAAVAREWVEAYPHPSGIIANNIMARGKHEAI